MKYLLFLIIMPVFAFELSSGTYDPIDTNNDSVCPQKVNVINSDDVTYLKVVYVGDCYYQGPYTYYCFQDVCTDGQIDYHLSSASTFTWINKNYRIWGKFKKR